MATKAQDNQEEEPVLSNKARAKAAHEAANKKRADAINEVRLSYAKIKDEPAFLDILAKIKSYSEYHTKMGKDGIGFRKTGQVNMEGKELEEMVVYDKDKRMSEIDKSAGIDEVGDYINRQLEAAAAGPVKPKKVIA